MIGRSRKISSDTKNPSVLWFVVIFKTPIDIQFFKSICKEMRILQDKTGRKFYGYIVALGGADRSLSVWSIPGSSCRPIVVIHNIVDQPIYDMTWHGRCLGICSRDGTTRFVSFKESEIGQPASTSEFHQHCIKKLGRRFPGFHNEEEEAESSDAIADKFYLIPEEDDFQWNEENPTVVKKKKKEKKVEEKKEEPAAPVQLVFKSKKKSMKLETCQLETEGFEEEVEEKKNQSSVKEGEKKSETRNLIKSEVKIEYEREVCSFIETDLNFSVSAKTGKIRF